MDNLALHLNVSGQELSVAFMKHKIKYRIKGDVVMVSLGDKKLKIDKDIAAKISFGSTHRPTSKGIWSAKGIGIWLQQLGGRKG